MLNKKIKNNGLPWVNSQVIGLLLICFFSVFRPIQAQENNEIMLTNGLTDGMTLAAHTLLDIAGQAPAGRTLDVKLVLDNTTITMARVLVNSDGHWQVSLAEQGPSGPYKLTIGDGELSKVVHDIYIEPADYTARNPKGNIILSTRLFDDMLLKPNEVIEVNGFAEPGRMVNLKLLREQQTITMARVQTGPDGQWKATMAAQEAGGPWQLSVSDGRQYKMINGIIIGQADLIQAPLTPNELAEPNTSNSEIVETADDLVDATDTLDTDDTIEITVSEYQDEDRDEDVEEDLEKDITAQKGISGQINKGYLQQQLDVSDWTLVDLRSLETLVNNDTILARKEVHFAVDPQVVTLSLGQANQVEQIIINGHILESQSWKDNPLQIKVPKGMFQSGDNIIALLSVDQWDNTRFIGSTGRFKMTIDQFTLELAYNWRVIYPEEPFLGRL